MKRFLTLTSGGDSPGMNAVIRAIYRTCVYNNIELFACHNGYQGLVDQDIFALSSNDITGTIQHGGTILRSSRCEGFLSNDVRKKCINFLANQQIDGLITIGGDGTFRGASLLATEGGPKVIGIPGTIDNDVIGTDYTIGFDTARNTALRAVDNIRDTAYSNNRYFLVEVMGQRAGFLAIDVGIAGGADYILIPEFPITSEKLAEKINAPRRPKNSLIIIVAEAGTPGRCVGIAQTLRQLTPFEYRVCVLGHIQRGGSPTVMDRQIGSRMGNLAVNALIEGNSIKMTAMKDNKLILTEIPGPKSTYRKIMDKSLIDLGMVLSS